MPATLYSVAIIGSAALSSHLESHLNPTPPQPHDDGAASTPHGHVWQYASLTRSSRTRSTVRVSLLCAFRSTLLTCHMLFLDSSDEACVLVAQVDMLTSLWAAPALRRTATLQPRPHLLLPPPTRRECVYLWRRSCAARVVRRSCHAPLVSQVIWPDPDKSRGCGKSPINL